MPQGISINLHSPLKATAEIKKSTDSRSNNNSVVEKVFRICSIQCIKSAKISLKWTVSHLYCQLAFQPLMCSECIAMEKITEAWAGIRAFTVLFITSQSWLLFFRFRQATYLLYHYLGIVSFLCPFFPYFPLSLSFLSAEKSSDTRLCVQITTVIKVAREVHWLADMQLRSEISSVTAMST